MKWLFAIVIMLSGAVPATFAESVVVMGVPNPKITVKSRHTQCCPVPSNPAPVEPPKFEVPKPEAPPAAPPVADKPFNWNVLYIAVGLVAFVGTLAGALVGGYFANESDDE